MVNKNVDFERLDFIERLVMKELGMATGQYPPFNSQHEGYAIVREEFKEFEEAVFLKQSNSERNIKMRKEAIQLCAMTLRFLHDVGNFRKTKDNQGYV